MDDLCFFLSFSQVVQVPLKWLKREIFVAECNACVVVFNFFDSLPEWNFNK